MERARVGNGRSVEPAKAAQGKPAAPQDRIRELARATGNRGLARLAANLQVLARAPAPVAAPEKPPSIEGPWGIDLTNAEQLAAYFRMGAGWVESDLKETKGAGKDLDTRAREFMDEMTSWSQYYETKGTAALTKEDVKRAEELIDIGGKIRTEFKQVREEAAAQRSRAAMWKAHEQAERLAKEAEKLAPAMADSARAAFKAGDEDLLTSLADITGNITDIGLGIHQLSKDIADFIRSGGKAVSDSVNKYTAALEKLNKGLAGINLALSITGKRGKTELDEGLRQVGFAAGAFSSLGTLVGLPAHMGLYANLYLVPLTKACIAGVQRLGEYVHIQNKSWVEFIGEPANFMVEPGGKPMWQYMVAVMRANDVKDMPRAPGSVSEYFDDYEDEFNAGTSGEEMPDTDSHAKFSQWLFYRRKQVWSMLYGSMKVPTKR